jgi:hypothetical protein
MPLKAAGVIEIPGADESSFDHGAFEPKSRRVFVAHTARNRVEAIDPEAVISQRWMAFQKPRASSPMRAAFS